MKNKVDEESDRTQSAAVAAGADGERHPRPRLILVGGGRLAGLIYSTFHRFYEIIGYVDAVHREAYLTTTYGVPCLGTSEALASLKEPAVSAVVAITDAAARKRYGELLASLEFPLATLIFPTAVVDEFAQIGPGCLIRHQAVIGPQVRLGSNCVVSDNAYVAHDSTVGAHTYISPGVNVNGSVVIGEACFLGTGAVVIPERRLGDGCTVGAAACVIHDVAPGETVVGVPARPVRGAAQTQSEPDPAPTRPSAPSAERAPLVSVLLTSYNHGRFIGEAIQSVLDQTLEDFELIIVDDASTDDSVAVIESFRDPRLRFVRHEKNQGIGPTKNHAFMLARGTYVAILNSDDAWLPEKLEKQIEVFRESPGVGEPGLDRGSLGSRAEGEAPLAAVFTGVQVIDEEGRPFRDRRHFYFNIFDQPDRTREEWLHYFFFRGNCLCAPSVLLHRERVSAVGYFDRRMRQLGDLDLWVRLALRYRLHLHPERLTRFRVLAGEGNLSGATFRALVASRWEYSRLLSHYLSLSDPDELFAIFPEARDLVDTSLALDSTDIAFVIAQLALKRTEPFAWLFALETLFGLLADEQRAARLHDRYGFGYRDFTDLTARLDLFGLSEARRLCARVRRRAGRLLRAASRPGDKK